MVEIDLWYSLGLPMAEGHPYHFYLFIGLACNTFFQWYCIWTNSSIGKKIDYMSLFVITILLRQMHSSRIYAEHTGIL